MALPGSGTPKNKFQTPRRLAKNQISFERNLKTGTPVFSTPNRSSLVTPKSQHSTPRTLTKSQCTLTDTPECFNTVTVETPVSNSSNLRTSKEKNDEISNLTVAVRIRPMNSRELACMGVDNIVSVREQELVIHMQGGNSSAMSIDHIFQYDHIFWSCDEKNLQYSTQQDVFVTMGKPLLDNVFRGYNACLFAYGQTGSGKSYSMMGRNVGDMIDIDSEDYSGITPRFCRELFHRISELESTSVTTVEVSYFEIYNEKIHDLLANQSNSNRTPLKVREHPVWGPYVVDLSVHTVRSYNDLRNFLLTGNRNRATAATVMNDKSSRSHSIFSIELGISDNSSEEASSRRSRISLVDLAGSERLTSSSHNNDEKLKQGVYINKSLLTLGKVISALADQKKNQFVPYRESVLTWLLRESLGGNSLTSMLATITPASTHVDETLSTLRYACQARSIVNRARVNENPHDRLIRELRTEVERLRALRRDYERNSLSSSSIICIDDTKEKDDELEDLRMKLQQTEKILAEAQQSWEERFMETKKCQMRELAEAERYKEELESRVRIMKTADNNIILSPYKTNFIKELEGMLTEDTEPSDSDILHSIHEWCTNNGYICTRTNNSLIIIDASNNKQTVIALDSVNFDGFENISDFLVSLKWTNIRKKLSKTDISSSMNQIYQVLASLKPEENDTNLSLLFAKVNKSLQSFEAALQNSVKTNKAVTFDLKE